MKSKLEQLISRLSFLLRMFNNHPAAGDLINSIKDRELKSRCVDLLGASANFDRAIREATVVLEQRIRNRAGNPLDKDGKSLIGTNLVAAAMNSDISKAILKFSSNPSEHEGLALICRGLAFSFRNATHHNVSEAYSREDAIKVCAFIDNILTLIEKAEVKLPT